MLKRFSILYLISFICFLFTKSICLAYTENKINDKLLIKSTDEYCVLNSTNQFVICNKFESLDLLELGTFLADEKIKTIVLEPLQPIVFDDALNLKDLSDVFQNNYRTYLINYSGFNLTSNPFKDIVGKNGDTLILDTSSINLYDSNYTENAKLNCDLNSISNDLSTIFSNFNKLELRSTVKYPSELCPLMFKNANLQQLKLIGLTSTNNVRFSNFIPSTQSDVLLNSQINRLEIVESNLERLNTKILDKDVFSSTKEFIYETSQRADFILKIDNDTFTSLKHLRSFELSVNNLEEVLDQPKEWLQSLNNLGDLQVDLDDADFFAANRDKQFKLILRDQFERYTFPDKDLCLFKYFPHNRLVFPFLYTKKDIECSCTVVWLLRYGIYANDYMEYTTSSTASCFNENLQDHIDFDERIKKCDFDTRFLFCDYNPTAEYEISEFVTFKGSEMRLEGFKSFSEISYTNYKEFMKIGNLVLKPSLPVVFEELDLSPLIFNPNYEVEMEHISEFDYLEQPFDNKGSKLILKNSELKFKNLQCDLNSIRNSFVPILSRFSNLVLDADIKYPLESCKLIFKNADINTLELNGLNDNRKFQFQDYIPSSSSFITLNSRIQTLHLKDANFVNGLNNDLLDPDVLKETQTIIYSEPNVIITKTTTNKNTLSIPKDLFRPLTNLRTFDVGVNDFSNFVRGDLEWLDSLNYATDNATRKEFTLILRDNNKDYEYNDDDLCLFRNFPHQNLVYPVIYTKERLPCTCTLAFLLQNAEKYSDQTLIRTTSVNSCFRNLPFKIQECRFPEKLRCCTEDCSTTTPTPRTDSTTARRTTTPFTTAEFRNTLTTTKGPRDNTLTIVFSVIGGLFGLLCIGVGIFVFCKISKKEPKIEINNETPMRELTA